MDDCTLFAFNFSYYKHPPTNNQQLHTVESTDDPRLPRSPFFFYFTVLARTCRRKAQSFYPDMYENIIKEVKKGRERESVCSPFTRLKRTDGRTMKLIGFGCHKLIKVLNRDRVQCGCVGVRACMHLFGFSASWRFPIRTMALTFDPPAVVVVLAVVFTFFLLLLLSVTLSVVVVNAATAAAA